MHIIKKYDNRKLYSTKLNKYIVLSDVIELVKSNAEFKVYKDKTQEDITKQVLKSAIQNIDLDLETLKSIVKYK